MQPSALYRIFTQKFNELQLNLRLFKERERDKREIQHPACAILGVVSRFIVCPEDLSYNLDNQSISGCSFWTWEWRERKSLLAICRALCPCSFHFPQSRRKEDKFQRLRLCFPYPPEDEAVSCIDFCFCNAYGALLVWHSLPSLPGLISKIPHARLAKGQILLLIFMEEQEKSHT